MKLCARSTVVAPLAIFLSVSSSALAQTQAAKGQLEGIVLETGGASPQPVSGARITGTKVPVER